MIYIGIDVGRKGAMCILKDTSIEFIDYALLEYIVALKDLQKLPNSLVIGIELVHSMPRQGVKSMFSFGQRLGELIGIMNALDLDYTLVPPRTWQKLLLPKDIKSSKEAIAEATLKLYPNANLYSKRGSLKDGRADALGITHFLKNKGNSNE